MYRAKENVRECVVNAPYILTGSERSIISRPPYVEDPQGLPLPYVSIAPADQKNLQPPAVVSCLHSLLGLGG